MVVDQNYLEKNIISLLGIEALPHDQKLGLLNKMSVLIERRVIAKILLGLPDVVQDEFVTAIEQDNMDVIGRIIGEHVPDFAKLLDEEMAILKKEMVGVVEALEE